MSVYWDPISQVRKQYILFLNYCVIFWILVKWQYIDLLKSVYHFSNPLINYDSITLFSVPFPVQTLWYPKLEQQHECLKNPSQPLKLFIPSHRRDISHIPSRQVVCILKQTQQCLKSLSSFLNWKKEVKALYLLANSLPLVVPSGVFCTFTQSPTSAIAVKPNTTMGKFLLIDCRKLWKRFPPVHPYNPIDQGSCMVPMQVGIMKYNYQHI